MDITAEIAVKALGAILSGVVLVVLGRWASKLTKALDEQMVVNVETSGSLRLLNEKLAGHERIDEVRHENLTDRLGRLEGIAHRHSGA